MRFLTKEESHWLQERTTSNEVNVTIRGCRCALSDSCAGGENCSLVGEMPVLQHLEMAQQLLAVIRLLQSSLSEIETLHGLKKTVIYTQGVLRSLLFVSISR